MSRVLIIAKTTGYQIRSFGEAAEKLGVRLVFASDRCDQLEDPWWDRAIPIRFHDELGALHAIVEALVGSPPDGVVAVGDRPVTIAARVNEARRRIISQHFLRIEANDPAFPLVVIELILGRYPQRIAAPYRPHRAFGDVLDGEVVAE